MTDASVVWLAFACGLALSVGIERWLTPQPPWRRPWGSWAIHAGAFGLAHGALVLLLGTQHIARGAAIVAVRQSGSVAGGNLVKVPAPTVGAQLRSQTRRGGALNLLVAPLIYSMVLPIALLDVWATLYQGLCFRVYGIAQVRRSAHVIIDHHKLQYLAPLEKFNCVYCGYANGVISYVREIGGATEQYWCPIKHAIDVPDPHPRYDDFLAPGDADGYRSRLQQFRDRLAPGDEGAEP